jgi:DNA-binding CsgD family transcriptional regulator
MSGPSQYVRQCREEAAKRRLEIAKLLREDASLTNIILAVRLNVSRNTVTSDRKAIMEKLVQDTKTETELLRDGLVKKLEGLVAEVELHRKDGKLSLSAIDQVLSITKAVIELTGARRAVIEKTVNRHDHVLPQFTTKPSKDGKRLDWVKTDQGWKQVEVAPPQVIKAEFITEPAKLTGESDG